MLVHAGPCWSMLVDHAGPCWWTMLVHAGGPCWWSMLVHAGGPCWSMLVHAGPCWWIMLVHAGGPCWWSMLDHAGPCWWIILGTSILCWFAGHQHTSIDQHTSDQNTTYAGFAGIPACIYHQLMLVLNIQCILVTIKIKTLYCVHNSIFI